jgi:hypothetical protein
MITQPPSAPSAAREGVTVSVTVTVEHEARTVHSRLRELGVGRVFLKARFKLEDLAQCISELMRERPESPGAGPTEQ